jgi:hypothetical protein
MKTDAQVKPWYDLSNEHILAEYIKEKNPQSICPDWVIWMLDLLWDANKHGLKINPEWLRSNPTGWHTPTGFVPDPEPHMSPTQGQ